MCLDGHNSINWNNQIIVITDCEFIVLINFIFIVLEFEKIQEITHLMGYKIHNMFISPFFTISHKINIYRML